MSVRSLLLLSLALLAGCAAPVRDARAEDRAQSDAAKARYWRLQEMQRPPGVRQTNQP